MAMDSAPALQGRVPSYSAGILPFAFHENKTYFLVGKDGQDGTWSDFGGKYESKDRSYLDTAQREFYEETCGCVMDMRALRLRMSLSSNIHVLRSSTQSKHLYLMYIVEIPFDACLRTSFKRTLNFLRFSKASRNFMEKSDVQWVTVDDLFSSVTLRSVFHATINRHVRFLHDLSSRGCLNASAACDLTEPPAPLCTPLRCRPKSL